jgi:geranylgeranyl diphosphate synthase, type II
VADHTASPIDQTVAEVERDRREIDAALARVCERDLESLHSRAPDVASAIRYSLLGGGKRFRGILLLAAYRAAGGRSEAAPLAAAVEIVHAYSLVHDDLPCMDDDDVRRGRPTVHKVYGVRAATVAGLTMVPLAVSVAARAAHALHVRDSREVVSELMRASGAGGMIGGQLLDLEGEGKPLSLTQLEQMHRGKTGALVRAAATLGGIAARADQAAIDALARYGDALGLAFQIADDVLDVTGTTEVLGKAAGRDAARGKSTYPALLGVEGAIDRAKSLVRDGCATLERLDLLTPALEGMAHFVVRRTS